MPPRAAALLVAGLAVLLVAGRWPDGPVGGEPAPTSGGTTVATLPAPVVATGLQPGLVAAFEQARVAAARAGRRLTITSGFRTAAEQEALLAEAVEEHGSEAAARRWVFPPDRSMHVRGLAIDVGDRRAAAWLDAHGAGFGLCRTLAWEWWHFEWRDAWASSGTCPAPATDPADAATGP